MFTSRTLLEGKWPLLILALLTGVGAIWCVAAATVAGLLLLFTISFFRDPARPGSSDPAEILAAADGKIVQVETVTEPHYLQGECVMVAIFLSIFDVHVQRSPVAGTVKLVKYNTGKFLDARNPNAPAQNESQTIGIETDDGCRIAIRQIAGLIARRIVGWKHEGASLAAGDRVGMIRFGSRVEMYLPTDAEILVKPGQYAKGGETIVARRS
jgi:phosphatidylserine decarboxylase